MSVSEKPSAGKSQRGRLLLTAAVVAFAAVGLLTWLLAPEKARHAAAAPALTGEAVKQVLLDGDELTTMLNQPFKHTPGSLVYGGFAEMDNSSPPSDCAGVVDVAPQSVYRPEDVHSYVRETWAAEEPGHADFQPLRSKVMFVKMSDGQYRIVPRTGRVDDLIGMLHDPDSPPLTLAQIDEAIAEGGAASGLRGLPEGRP